MAERTYIATQAIGLPRKVVRPNGEFTVDAETGDALVKDGLAKPKGKTQAKAAQEAAKGGEKDETQGNAQGGTDNATSGQDGKE